MDIILYNIIIGFCALLIGYFFGSIPTGVIIGKVFYHQDPRLLGSKNSGGTNVGRLFGKKTGLIVIILDMIKTVAALIIVWSIIKFSNLSSLFQQKLGQPMWENGVPFVYLAPIGAMIGHCFPIFAGFKGGKAVATIAGFVLATSWFVTVISVFVFFVVLKLKKYVSLSSILGVSFAAVAAWGLAIINLCTPMSFANFGLYGSGSFVQGGIWYAVTVTIGAILLIVRHTPNMKRLAAHTESKIKWMS